jgi:hypothetical protein
MLKQVRYQVYVNGQQNIFYSWDAAFKFCQQNNIDTINIKSF